MANTIEIITRRYIICEKDVGLFSLVQQVIAHIPSAKSLEMLPIAFFGSDCCYWHSSGFQGKTNVWEYYFEPLQKRDVLNQIPEIIRDEIKKRPPDHKEFGYFLDEKTFITNNFGHHTFFKGKALQIPYKWKDPDPQLRQKAKEIIQEYIRPNLVLREKAEKFYERNMLGTHCFGVHVRSSDVSDLWNEFNVYRRHSFKINYFLNVIRSQINLFPEALIFLATDSQETLQLFKAHFPERLVHYSSVLAKEERKTGKGPMGWKMPGFLTKDSYRAALNGEEAVIDFLLLGKCNFLIHNGSGLARTVLLNHPELEHKNVHSFKSYLKQLLNPLTLEFFFLTYILIQKLKWKAVILLKKSQRRISKDLKDGYKN